MPLKLRWRHHGPEASAARGTAMFVGHSERTSSVSGFDRMQHGRHLRGSPEGPRRLGGQRRRPYRVSALLQGSGQERPTVSSAGLEDLLAPWCGAKPRTQLAAAIGGIEARKCVEKIMERRTPGWKRTRNGLPAMSVATLPVSVLTVASARVRYFSVVRCCCLVPPRW